MRGLLPWELNQATRSRLLRNTNPRPARSCKCGCCGKTRKGNNNRVKAQEWVQHTSTGKQMEYSWVFGGSEIYVDEMTGKKTYMADGGDLICVSNFTSAMLDIPVPSSDSNSGLSFRAFTERIPPSGTPYV